ncbi:lipopolysaccharide biosynthesis protein [Mucilaginibacter sp. BT774]|uniref:lipopolysaccharide biosynthesis protein n=1 Tax=Mucilaginibacter sp. BT774 TaxID=3062276 RepID=UPI00267756C5|nr:oligosaccharide flippase family protein [Mucilaginibacter sp. BT774]MDO3626112.1 oligosaccharide flippase family protein [Mucilaginibacter sp. BT774]
MIGTLKNTISAFFSKGHERTVLAKKNIAFSFFLKCISIVVGFVLIPLTISYVNQSEYGVWVTLSSIISWLSFFDVGLGNGLKNKLAETNALKQYDKSVTYVSTTYAVLGLIASGVFIVFLIGNNFINWPKILNAQSNNLTELALIVFGFFCLQFVSQIISTVLTAFHAPAKSSLISVIGQLLVLGIIFALTKTTKGSLLYLGLTLAGIPVVVQILASIWLYSTEYKIVAPSFKAVNFKYVKDLLGIGGVFFIIQIGALILFQTDNIIITQLFGPQNVTVFNVAYRLFSMVIMVSSIILTPFWSAYTDAYAKNDFVWMRRTLKKTRNIWLILSAGAFLLLIVSPFVYKIWLHGKVDVPFSVSIAMFLYVVGFNLMQVNCFFLNGIGKIRIQLYLYIFSIIVNIPIAIFLARFFNIAGVTLSNVFIFVIMGIILHIQCNKILNKTATGLWDK